MPEWKKDLPPIPKWDLTATATRAAQLYKKAFKALLNCTLDAESRNDIVALLQEDLRIPEAAVLAVVETLLPYNERLMTKPLAELICMQFAANWRVIKAGTPVQKFTGVPVSQWVPMEILGFEKEVRGKYTFAKTYLRILDGTYAGFGAVRSLPLGFLGVLANDLGFSRKRPYEEPVDLVGLRLAAWVNPSPKDDINFDKYWLTSSMQAHNDALVKHRKPTDKEIEEGYADDSDS